MGVVQRPPSRLPRMPPAPPGAGKPTPSTLFAHALQDWEAAAEDEAGLLQLLAEVAEREAVQRERSVSRPPHRAAPR